MYLDTDKRDGLASMVEVLSKKTDAVNIEK